jgi:hypothetical protein
MKHKLEEEKLKMLLVVFRSWWKYWK